MNIMLILEMIGTFAFAVSGAITGIRKELDIFGVAVLGLTTAAGGGLLRDLVLNVTPVIFSKPLFAVIAVLASLIVFIDPAEYIGRYMEKLLLLMDSVGLGIFTVLGVKAAFDTYPDANLFLVTFAGVLTAVGGGILRDIFTGNTPKIFVKHFYACASIIGAFVCALFRLITGDSVSLIAGAFLIMLIRILAARYRWNLPKTGTGSIFFKSS